MPRFALATMLFAGLLAAQPDGKEKEKKASPFDAIDWTKGPSTGPLKDQATIDIPEGYVFTGADGTKKFLELTQNFPSGREYGMLAPASLDWFAIFEFSASGYVKDDEKQNLDAAALLSNLRENTQASNEERKSRGWATMEIVGWKLPPRFNDKTKNLEWATEARSSDGGVSVNHNTRILGRHGYMSVTLVGDPQGYGEQLGLFTKTMAGYQYKPDNSYSAFRSGDKIAEYGLAALIVGGGAAVATKTGLLKSFWKLIVLGVVAVGGFLKKIFTRSKPDDESGGQESQISG